MSSCSTVRKVKDWATKEMSKSIVNIGAEGVSFFTPRQDPPAGSALKSEKKVPALFTPITIRNAIFHNRLWVR